ncbi:erythrocyte membrane protein 1, PfEMP1, putative [Plasmodium sp. gorilla clade G1]|nr:erythrocyte membrane protein 1, PfEMP1, putative [Plasmodium sp. gorilla clade G1]
MAPQSGGQSARDVLEEYGEKIQQEATRIANNYREYLHGNLKSATYPKDKESKDTTPSEACALNYQYHTNVTKGYDKENPCGNRPDVRFSDKYGGQCTDSKIKGNVGNNGGACAPFRRLFLCDQNLEHIKEEKIENTHNLLLEVLLAAKHEGESLAEKYKEYKNENGDFDCNICTVLARSFADIGDIVRGKDLFLGTNEEKKPLEENLKKLFKKLYDELTRKHKNGTEIKSRYEKDGQNFYQLREHWWNANRQEVWKAITCGAEDDDKYTKKKRNGETTQSSHIKCRNVSDPPTNLDYVPQYLRWFDEWSEDFCRKKKQYIDIVRTNCLDETSEKYCSRNGHDCTKTIRAKGKYSMDHECPKCLFECSDYIKWKNKKKEEFDKQKNKYKNEIKKDRNQNQALSETIHDNYENNFYMKFKKTYEDVNTFLKLLNNDTNCKANVGGNSEVDFTVDDNTTFQDSDYCQTCSWCGMKQEGNKWISKEEKTCRSNDNDIKVSDNSGTTNIEILFTGKDGKDIIDNLNSFCSNEDVINEKWKCHYEKSQDDDCILQNYKELQCQKTIMEFDSFFWRWVTYMLKDSIDWRKKINKCIINGKKGKCRSECKNNCKCFERWVEKKKKEWKQIKEHFDQQKDLEPKELYKTLEMFLELFFIDQIKKAYGEEQSKELIEKLKKNNASEHTKGTVNEDDAIKVLLDHEILEAKDCVKYNQQDTCPVEPAGTKPKITDIDDHFEEEEETHYNPCANPSANYPSMVMKIARQMNQAAKKQLRTHGSSDYLIADATKGTYRLGGQGDKLDATFCNINDSYSNHHPINSRYPCYGKDKEQIKFVIGTEWSYRDNDKKKTHPEAYMPPRREHMCTSNLEYLETGEGALNSTDGTLVNNSFLGDVLLAAYRETEKTINHFKNKKDNHAACRAVRRSFADIADIIRGRDMWVDETGMKKLRDYLQKIFGTIHKSLKQKGNHKYKDEPNHIKLREDWWEANRYQVWKAMKCQLSELKDTSDQPLLSGDCQYNSGNSVPLDDYIPQRLRWMTEWSEWFCKEQKKQYEILEKQCRQCKGKKENCRNDENECATCAPACTAYKGFIDTWKKQWKEMEQNYLLLYEKARFISSVYGGIDAYIGLVDKKDIPVVLFLKELQKVTGDTTPPTPTSKTALVTTPYSTAAGYIHQELQQVGCNTQKEFCKNGNGDKHAFENPPPLYKEACGCNERLRPVLPETKEEKPCDIVKPLLNNNDGTRAIYGCERKREPFVWKCESIEFKGNKEGPCMPPRRQKLCINDLKVLKDQPNANEQDLKKAFIKCAAKEIHFLWKKYKDDKKNKTPKDATTIVDPDNELKSEKIPEDFKRQMFYTFGDYRDLCLGNDLGSSNDTKDISGTVTRILGTQKGVKQIAPESWWTKIEKEVWNGMLCALEKASGDTVTLTEKPNYAYPNVTFSGDNSHTLEEFTTRPQFLRWMTEWGEHFCREQSLAYKELVEGCTGYDCKNGDPSKKQQCEEACRKYKEWLKNWKKQYTTQSKKYAEDKRKQQYKSIDDVTSSDHAYEYLYKQIKQFTCEIGDCNCMKDVSTEPSIEGIITETIPQSLDEEPQEVKGKCECQDEAQHPEIPEVNPVQPEDACTIVDEIFKPGGKTYFDEACNLKYKGGKERYTQWNYDPSKFKKEHSDACMPPRRQKLYIKKLENFRAGTSPENDLRKAFIESAAIETFFAWHKFKIDKKKEEEEKKDQNVGLSFQGIEDDTLPSEEYNPQKELDGGTVPDDFKRQLFYTFGDYRDLCLGKDIGKDMETIKNNIDKVFENTGKGAGKTITPITADKWWDSNAKAIWEGMLCALSYNTKTKEMDPQLRQKLTTEPQNSYNSVTINGGPSNGIPLSVFATRSQFFRWLEEWADEFCRKRKHKLEKAKKKCQGYNASGDKIYCSGDGHDCKLQYLKNNDMFADLNCPDCEKECTNYNKWIVNKRNEFYKHKNKYEKEIIKLSSSFNNDDKEFYQEIIIKDYTSVDKFLESFNEVNEYQGNEDEKNKIDFKNPENTFSSSTYCKTCPLYGISCNNKGICTHIGEHEFMRKNALDEIIIKDKTPTSIDVEMIDRRGQYMKDNLKNLFKKSYILKSMRDQKWKCSFINNKMDICKLDDFNESVDNDNSITFKVLIERWLQDFLEGYYISKRKIELCTQKQENICNEDCKNKYECVAKWIKKKKEEWNQINEHFKKREHDSGHHMAYKVRMCFEQDRFLNSFINVIKGDKDIKGFEELRKCHKNECYRDIIGGIKHDFITQLLGNLEEKIKECNIQPHEPQAHCNKHPPEEDSSISLDPDEQPDDDPDTSTTPSRPDFCPQVEPQPEPELEPEPEPEADGGPLPDTVPEQKEDEKPPAKVPEVPKKTVPEKKVTPKQPKRRPREVTHSILPEMVSISAFPLSVGIAFAALSYFVLKKKSKSAIDLLRVIDIPKGDYGIPTLKSKNRYIPYTSDRRKGKTYIYMEGDSGDEYTFMSDTTDITSASESEYEELDINDIYVPGSPKYKTLIEVVLEPSKRDTMNTQSDIPLNDKLDSNKLTDEEWNQLKKDFISKILQNSQMDLPQNNISRDTSINTHPDVSILHDSMQEKPFITSIHDRDLHNGEEVTYNINLDDHKNMNFSTNHDNIPPKNNKNDLYTGLDLINDSISGNHNVDIYDELLKRKENELFGTNHTKHTTTNSIAKKTHNDPIVNQINLFHKWLDRHKNMCEHWNNNERLYKLKELWDDKDNNNSNLITVSSDSNIQDSDIKMLNTDVSIEIDMDDHKPINQYTNMYTNPHNSTTDTIFDDMEQHRKPYYYDIYEDDITYFDIDDEKKPMGHIYVDNNKADVPNKVCIDMNIANNKKEIFEKEYPISDIWNI